MTNTPTHARTELGTDAHKHPKRAEVRCITFPILFLMAVPQKKACGVPPTSSACVCVCVCVGWASVCVCQCQGTDAALSCGRYANERRRCWGLRALAQLSQADNTLTPQHLHFGWHDALQLPACTQTMDTRANRHACACTLCARKESSHRPLHPQTTTHWHTQADPGETNPLSAGMLSLHQIDKRSRGFSFPSCNTLVNCNHCASFYAVDREHKPAVKHNIYFPQPN